MISAIKKRINTKILSYIDYAVSKRATDNTESHPLQGERPCRPSGSGNRYRAVQGGSYETKEPETLEWIERFFRPWTSCTDIGANRSLRTVRGETPALAVQSICFRTGKSELRGS